MVETRRTERENRKEQIMRTSIAGITVLAATALAALAPAAQAADCGATASSPVSAGTTTKSGVYVKSDSEKRAVGTTICLINAERAARGVKPLRRHALLVSLANKHAGDLVRNGVTGGDLHAGSNGSTPMTRLRPYTANFGRASFQIGETVVPLRSDNSPAAAVRAWIGSATHRAILLDPRLEDVGLGVYAKRPGGGAGGTYVANFGTVRN
jgi:uncharacterized protein YkwD